MIPRNKKLKEMISSLASEQTTQQLDVFSQYLEEAIKEMALVIGNEFEKVSSLMEETKNRLISQFNGEISVNNLEQKGFFDSLVKEFKEKVDDVLVFLKETESAIDVKTKKTLKEIKDLFDEKEKEINKKIEGLENRVNLNTRSQGTGASMYQSWITDSTFDGTMVGDVNDLNQDFVLRNYPRPNAFILYWNNGSHFQITGDFTLTGNKITTNFVPSSGDTLTAVYPV